MIAGEAMDAVEGVITSPGWRTVSSVIKNRLANAISSQNPQQVAAAVSMAQQALPKQSLRDLMSKYTTNTIEQEQPPAGPDWWKQQGATHPEVGQQLADTFTDKNIRSAYPNAGAEFWEGQPHTHAETVQRYKELFDEARARDTQKAPLSGVMQRFGVPTKDTPGMHIPRADAAWWESQPDYAGLFDQADQLHPPQKPTVQGELKRSGTPTTETPEGVHRAGTEWWRNQPDYAAMFDQADKLAARRARTAPTVPETGVPENVARVVDARERMAKSLTGKPWDKASASEQNIIDQMITEGHGQSVQPIRKYARGGIIKSPTILVDAKTRKTTGIMAEEGPEAIVPMKDGLGQQLDDLTSMKRRVVMVPKGAFPRSVPEGMVTHADQRGNKFIFNPNLISKNDIRVAIATNRIPHLLGGGQSRI